MIRNSFEWFTVDSDGRHVVEGTSEPMFPVAAVALITLLSRLGDALVSEIVHPTINEICNRLFLSRAYPREKSELRGIIPYKRLCKSNRCFYRLFQISRNSMSQLYICKFLLLCTYLCFFRSLHAIDKVSKGHI